MRASRVFRALIWDDLVKEIPIGVFPFGVGLFQDGSPVRRNTTVDQSDIRGLVTAWQGFVGSDLGLAPRQARFQC